MPAESDSPLTEFEDALMLLVDPEQLTNNLLAKLKELISVEKAFVYLADRAESSRIFSFVGEVNRDRLELPDLAIDSKTIQWFRTNRRILLLNEQQDIREYLREELQPLLDLAVSVSFPLI